MNHIFTLAITVAVIATAVVYVQKHRKMDYPRDARILFLIDGETDDIAALLALAAQGYTNVTVLVGKGYIRIKWSWMLHLFHHTPAMKGWKLMAGVMTESDEFPECPVMFEGFVPEFNLDEFKLAIEAHDIILCTKPLHEFLSLPEDTVFRGKKVFCTMSFNLRDTAKFVFGPAPPKDALEQNALRVLNMFPDHFVWVESFVALGPENANVDQFTFKHPVLHEVQQGMNQQLLAGQMTSVARRAQKLGIVAMPGTMGIAELTLNERLKTATGDEKVALEGCARSLKCAVQVGEHVKTNALLVDVLLIPLLSGKYPLKRVKYTGHDGSYPKFEDTEEGNLFISQGTPEERKALRDEVMAMMNTM